MYVRNKSSGDIYKILFTKRVPDDCEALPDYVPEPRVDLTGEIPAGAAAGESINIRPGRKALVFRANGQRYMRARNSLTINEPGSYIVKLSHRDGSRMVFDLTIT